MTCQRVDVEVVGRLVEQQHVRLVEQQPQELQPAPLAAGQVGHPRGQLVAGEPEVLEQRVGADLAAARQFGDPAAILDGVEHPLGRRRFRPAPGSGSRSCSVVPRLIVPAAGCSSPVSSRSTDVLPVPLTPTSPMRAPGPIDQSSRRRITRRIADLQPHPVQVEHVLAQPGGRKALQHKRIARRRLVGDQLVGGLDAELRLRRPRRRSAPQPRQLLAHQVAATRLGARGQPHPLGARQHVGGVPAVVGVDGAVVHLPRPWCTPRRGTSGRG